MDDKSILVAAGIIAGAILLNGYAEKDSGRYLLSAAGNDGQTVWRLDTRNGHLSMCGSVIDGSTFSQIEARQESAILSAAQSQSQDEKAKVLEQAQQTSTLSATRCTDWTDE